MSSLCQHCIISTSSLCHHCVITACCHWPMLMCGCRVNLCLLTLSVELCASASPGRGWPAASMETTSDSLRPISEHILVSEMLCCDCVSGLNCGSWTVLCVRLLFYWWWRIQDRGRLLPDNWPDGWCHQCKWSSPGYCRDRGCYGEKTLPVCCVSVNNDCWVFFILSSFFCDPTGWTSSCSRNSRDWDSTWHQRRR